VRRLLVAAFIAMVATAHGAITNAYMLHNTNTLEIVPATARAAISNLVVNLPGWGVGGTNTATLATAAAAGGFAGTETIAPSGVVAHVLSVPRTDYILVTDGGGCNPGVTGRYANVNGATNANGWIWEIASGTTNMLVDPTSAESYYPVSGGAVEGVYSNQLGGGTIATGLVRVAYDTIIADATGIDGRKLAAGSVNSSAMDAETDAAYRSGGGTNGGITAATATNIAETVLATHTGLTAKAGHDGLGLTGADLVAAGGRTNEPLWEAVSNSVITGAAGGADWTANKTNYLTTASTNAQGYAYPFCYSVVSNMTAPSGAYTVFAIPEETPFERLYDPQSVCNITNGNIVWPSKGYFEIGFQGLIGSMAANMDVQWALRKNGVDHITVCPRSFGTASIVVFSSEFSKRAYNNATTNVWTLCYKNSDTDAGVEEWRGGPVYTNATLIFGGMFKCE
jgi:hypothetical protein